MQDDSPHDPHGIDRRSLLRALGVGAAGTGAVAGLGADGVTPATASHGTTTQSGSAPYVLDDSVEIGFATSIDHLLSTYSAGDDTYNHKFAIASQGVAVDAASGAKTPKIIDHSTLVDGQSSPTEPTLYMPPDSPKIGAYPDSEFFSPPLGRDVYEDAIVAVATTLSTIASVAVGAATVTEEIVNALDTYNDENAFREFGWSYWLDKTDVAHQAEIFLDHPAGTYPWFDVRSQAANTVYNEFTVYLGSDAYISPNATASRQSVGDGGDTDRLPDGGMPAPDSLSRAEKRSFGVRAVDDGDRFAGSTERSSEVTHVVDRFPFTVERSETDLSRREKIEREREARRRVRRGGSASRGDRRRAFPGLRR